MRFSYHEYSKYDEEEILNLYRSVGWTTYAENPSMLKEAYDNSRYILGAYDGEKLIGIVRVVGDGFSVILIQDILVLPEYQRKGVGTTLLKNALEKYPNVYQCELLTDNTEKTVSFYKSLGFRPANDFGCLAFLKM